VLVAVHACNTCTQWDITVWRGIDIFERPGHPKYPLAPGATGHELAGLVVQAGKAAGIPLERIRAALDTLPEGRTPTKRDWERLSSSWREELDERIATLEAIRGRLTTCIGCGCLSLQTCGLLNPDDEAARLGGGAHYLRRVSPHGRDLAQRAQ